MAEPLRLLVLSKDPTLFEGGSRVQGDARRRHIRYSEVMRDMLGPESEIRIITYTTRASGFRSDDPAAGLKLYGTASLHRATYLVDCARLARKMLATGWSPTAITTQTPWEEGGLGAILARRTGARFLPQLHFDLFSSEWRSEKLMNHWRALVARRVLRSATRVRAVSEPLRQNLVGLGIDSSRIDVIPVGVNFAPSGLSVEAAKGALDLRLAGHPVVLFVGRLVEEKNLKLWIDVASHALASIPQVRFVIVGAGHKAEEVQRLIAERELEHAILMLGPVGHERLPDVYRAADVFLLTSHHEGFGRVILEAAFAGVPAVATRCGGPEDIIQHRTSGLLADKGDADALARCVLDLLGNASLRSAYGKAAANSAYARFGLDALARKLVTHWSTP